MSVKTYSLKKDGNTKLSENFTVKEFRCKDGSDTILIDTDLVNLLQEIRDAFGKPITINSAYRNAAYNKKIGGATSSQHVKGTAADIRISTVPPAAIASWMENHIKTTGTHACGYYPISLFCHVDVRAKATLFQEYKKSKTKSVSSFGLGNMYSSYIPVAEIKEDDEVVEDRPISIFGKEYTTKGILKDGSNYLSPHVLVDAGLEVTSQGSIPIITTGTVKVKTSTGTKPISGFISNGTTYCGLKELLEFLGHEVDYDGIENVIIVK